MPTPRDLVCGVLPEQSFSVLYGKPETAKTFSALDMGLCISSGVPWHGHPVTAGPVVYIAAEGVGCLTLRILAWLEGRPAEVRNRVEACFRVVPRAVEFFGTSFDSLKDRIRALPDLPKLIIVDTLARCFLGADESLASDMSIFVARCDELRGEFSAAVMVVHHRSKEGEERGSSALRGAADTMIVAERRADLVMLRCTKQKDSEPFAPMAFQLERVMLQQNEDGVDRSSCRLLLAEPLAARRVESSSDAVRRTIASALRDQSGGTPINSACLIKATGLKRATLLRHLMSLIKAGCVARVGTGKTTAYRIVRMPDVGEIKNASH